MRIKKINGYENYYISDDGKVFSNYSGELVEKTPFYSHNGYKRIALWNKGKQKKNKNIGIKKKNNVKEK